MSITLCIKYALGRVTVEDVTWVFDELCGAGVVVKVTELVKQDRYSGKDFKIFFIECDQKKQANGLALDKLASAITKNENTGDKKGAKVSIDKYGHYWQVTFAKHQPKVESKAEFKPSIMAESEPVKELEGEPTVRELEKAMEALQTDDELRVLYGRKRGAEEGEIDEQRKRASAGKVIEATIAHNDPIYLEALRDTLNHFSELGLFPERS